MGQIELNIPSCAFFPAASNPATAQVTHGTNFSIWENSFADAASTYANLHLMIPINHTAGSNYVGNTFWRSSATSGDVVWATYTDLNQNTTTVSPGQGSEINTVSASTDNLDAGTATNSVATTTADRLAWLGQFRQGAAAGDTMTASARSVGTTYTVAWDNSVNGVELLVPAHAMALGGSSGATYTSVYATTRTCRSVTVGEGDYAEFAFTLPSNYTGNLAFSLWVNPLDTGTTTWTWDTCYVALGETWDGTYTTGSEFTITGGSATTFYEDKQRAANSGAAAGDTVKVRLTRTSTGTSTAEALILTAGVTYNVGSNKSCIRFSPQSFVQPSSSPASPSMIDGSNSSFFGIVFSNGSTTQADMCIPVPTKYLAGATMRVRWFSPSTGSLQMKALYSNVADDGSLDPTLTDPGTTTKASSGAGKLNESTFTVAMTAGNVFLLRLQRQSGDSIADDVTVVDCFIETIAGV